MDENQFDNSSYKFICSINWGEQSDNDFISSLKITFIKTNHNKPNLKRDAWFLTKVGDFILEEAESRLRGVEHLLVYQPSALFKSSEAVDIRRIGAAINLKAIEFYEGLIHAKENASPAKRLTKS